MGSFRIQKARDERAKGVTDTKQYSQAGEMLGVWRWMADGLVFWRFGASRKLVVFLLRKKIFFW
jgi:hypothetical protein